MDGGIAPYTYVLDNGLSSSGVFTELAPANYTLSVTDANGCTIDTSFVIEAGLDLDLQLPPTLELNVNERGFLSGLTNVAEDELSLIQWVPASAVDCATCLETSLTATSSQNLSLTIIHENGCIATASIQLIVRPRLEVFIPNAFSPDGDGSNDRFTIFANERVESVEEMLIADRWGEILYQQEDFPPNQTSEGWDGSFRGQPMNPGVYVYLVRVRLQNGEEKIFKGDVTLMR